jgi:hypothetical protein
MWLTAVLFFSEWADLVQDIGLREMTSLSTVMLCVHIGHYNNWECIPGILDNITSHTIHCITIIIYLRRSTIPTEDAWARIPPILARPHFKHLHKLELILEGTFEQMCQSRLWISQQLQSFEPLGIFHVH